MRPNRLSWLLVGTTSLLGSLLAVPSLAVSLVFANHVSDPGCPDQLVGAEHVPQQTADGANLEWKARTLVSLDWANDGFAAQVLWVGTDSQSVSDKWVEAGITHGWQGGNYYRFYTAHGDFANDIYDESLFASAPIPTIGNSYRFKGYSVTSPGTPLYRTQIDVDGTSYYYTWAGHSTNTVHYVGGYEARNVGGTHACEARIDATYAFASKFRRKSDSVFVYINNGVRYDGSAQGQIYWCSQPTTLRYWMHSQISNLVCP